MYKIRFNLGKGENFMKWKIINPDKSHFYLPKEESFILINCRLKNNKKTASKILAGANKTVCAWIEAEEFLLEDGDFLNNQGILKYNPRVVPYWFKNDDISMSLDNETFKKLVINNKNIYHLNHE